jgi:hypothetical protein
MARDNESRWFARISIAIGPTKSEHGAANGVLLYRRRMSDASLAEPAPENIDKKHRPSVLRWFKSQSWTALATLAIALIAAAVSIAAWLHPAHDGASAGASHSFSGAQSAQAKKNVCSAYATVRKGVFERSANPRPDDPVAKLELSTNRQLILLGGGAYLDKTLAAEPAAPADLAKAVNSISNALEHLAVNNLARVDKKFQTTLWRDFVAEDAQANKLCK